MRRLTTCILGVTLVMATAGTQLIAKKQKNGSGPGDVSIGVDASVWESSPPDIPNGLLPIGGAGQLNGEFTIAERLGIQVGLRAQERFVGPLPASWHSKKGKIGSYDAETGTSSPGLATWNFDWHIDLRGAHGVAAGTTLDDYDLSIETDVFGAPASFDLKDVPGGFPALIVLYQESFNVGFFGNPAFDPNVPGTYSFKLVLTPTSFKNPPLAVEIQVNVS